MFGKFIAEGDILESAQGMVFFGADRKGAVVSLSVREELRII